MPRYTRIRSVSFDSTPLALPVSLRLSRRCEPQTAGGDDDTFVTSVQTTQPMLTAELRTRDTATAENLSLGRRGELSFTVQAAEQGGAWRNVALAGAVLVAVELTYEQTASALATLRFVAEAESGNTDPFSAGDAS